MLPLAKFWTFVGQSFVPLAAAWIYFIRNGPNEGALISRAYFGLLLTLLVAAALIWSLALYVRAAKAKHLLPAIPPNTTFEDLKNRNRLLSWGTLIGFLIAVAVAMVAFGARYSESLIYRWDADTPLASSFLRSRKLAHQLTCSEKSCFAMGRRIDTNSADPTKVAEYIPFVTDGSLILFALVFFAGVIFLTTVTIRKSPTLRFDL
jgi:hypothetical protein